MTALLTVTCTRCGGDGYQHLFGPYYRWPCRACHGAGERPALIARIWLALRHGARAVTEGEY
jgi:hypothetical protein